jgi:hypothetical protein
MPIPILLGIAAAGAGLLGTKKAHDASKTNTRASSLNRRAEYYINKAKTGLEAKRSECQKSLETLGSTKLNVLNNGILPFVHSFKKIHNVDLRNSPGLEELSKFHITKQELAEMEKMGTLAEGIKNGAIGGVAAGALVAIGAYGAATTFGVVAGTGTAIGTLSGVAATNATLAFLGGGSLAAGGFGMVGGMAVLGSVAIGPALAVIGFVMNAKAQENLEKARANIAEAEKVIEQCDTASTLCDAIKDRCELFNSALNKLMKQLEGAVRTVNDIVKRYTEKYGSADFNNFCDAEKKSITAACSLAKTVKSILDTPILMENGALTKESEKVLKSIPQES